MAAIQWPTRSSQCNLCRDAKLLTCTQVRIVRALRVVVARGCSIAPWPATAPAAARGRRSSGSRLDCWQALLLRWSAMAATAAAGEMAASASSVTSANQVVPGMWGSFGSRPSPSFWCEQAPRPLSSVAHLPHFAPGQPTVEEYIVRHSDAERFREEHPACQGARLKSKGAPKLKVPGLVQVATPTTAVFQSACELRLQYVECEL